MNLNDASGLFTGLLVYGGMVAAASWLAMVIWTYRDMCARSRDRLAPLLVGLMVAVLTIPGLIIYLFLRPRETLSEAYERSLEEEALLQEIEEKPTCPGCRQRVDPHWQACPHCHTRLKRPCPRCGQLLERRWRALRRNGITRRGGAARSSSSTATMRRHEGRAPFTLPQLRSPTDQAHRTRPPCEFSGNWSVLMCRMARRR
jgi:hypothetical protein